MMFFAAFAVLLAFSRAAYQEAACANYDHPDYGCQGKCMSATSCPGGKTVAGLCPTQSAGIKCCFTANTDAKCATYDHPQEEREVGHCIATSQCPGAYYISNLCPTKPAGVKCCFGKPTGTCSGSRSRQELACDIKKHAGVFLLRNNGILNPLGKNDGASAYDNIVDTCNGDKAKRSKYTCSAGTARGGYVYLSTTVLQYILDLLNDGYTLQINTLAGACHSSNSWHYQGTAVDFQIRSGDPYQDWMSRCRAAGAVESLGRGDPGHKNHVHCAFSS